MSKNLKNKTLKDIDTEICSLGRDMIDLEDLRKSGIEDIKERVKKHMEGFKDKEMDEGWKCFFENAFLDNDETIKYIIEKFNLTNDDLKDTKIYVERKEKIKLL